jgi:DNA-binding XRE family transcriptional regulator
MGRTYHRWADIKDKKFSPEQVAALDREVARELLEMDLRALREAAGKTQEELAALTGMSQSQLSQVENRPNPRLSTLRRVVEALGGELEVVAVLGGKRVVLAGV